MYGLQGKHVIITGAARGIGRAIAERLSAEGCNLALWDIDAREVATTAETISGSGGNVQIAEVDVANPNAVRSAFASTSSAWKCAPDILVNNAGIGKVGSIIDGDPSDFERTMAVNVGGTYNCCHEIVPSMREAGRGLIINIASWFGKSGRPMSLAYCASKFAMIGMTQSMALDLSTHGIRVNAVCPGTIADTKMREDADAAGALVGLPSAASREHLIPLGRLGKPRDVANVVAFLASDDADYMTGQSINVTGGLWMN